MSHIEIYTKQFRVGYRPNVLVIQLHMFSWAHSWYKWQQLRNQAYTVMRRNACMCTLPNLDSLFSGWTKDKSLKRTNKQTNIADCRNVLVWVRVIFLNEDIITQCSAVSAIRGQANEDCNANVRIETKTNSCSYIL